ncbi:MAG TPA: hypothetical protein VGM06_23735, partial [Polyangiaceae bacterium]
MTSTQDGRAPLDRSVRAPTCEEAAEIAAAGIAIAQVDATAPDVADGPSPLPPAPPAPPPSAPAPAEGRPARPFAYSFSLGYTAFTAGPADPVVRGFDEQTTFNPAQGVRLGFEVAHTWGAWKHSLQVSAAYTRQSTTTTSLGAAPTGVTVSNGVSIDDRDVLLATIDACPVHVDYRFVSFIPCATFSMMQSRGNSGNNPGLE